MEMMTTRDADLTDFCLVLTPTTGAAERVSEAVRKRFAFLAEETRDELVARVAELVQKSVDGRPRKPITVSIALETDLIHGEVSDGDLFPFQIPLTR